MSSGFLINPADFLMGKVQPRVVFCLSENYFYRLATACKVSGHKRFGPCKRAEMEGCTLIGRAMGAALAVLVIELLASNGAEEVVLFGTCGALPNKGYEIGDLCSASWGTDLTKTHEDYQLPSSMSLQTWPTTAVKPASHLVSIHSLFALSLDQLPKNTDLVDMENVPVAMVAKKRGLAVLNLLLVSDQLVKPWQPYAKRAEFKLGLERAVQALKAYAKPSTSPSTPTMGWV